MSDEIFDNLNNKKKKDVGDRIRKLRIEKGLTQLQLSDGICTPSMISQVETGKAFPSIPILSQVATRLGTTYDALVADLLIHLSSGLQYKTMKILKERGSYEKALEICEILLHESTPMAESTTEISLDMSECLMYLNRCIEARGTLENVLESELNRTEVSNYTVSQIYNMIGSTYLLEFNLIDAVANYSIALTYTQTMVEPDIITGLINYNLGRSYEYKGDIDKALYHYDIASVILRSVEADNGKMANLYYAYAISYEKLGNLRVAEDYMNKAISLYHVNRDFKMVNRVRESAAFLISAKRDKFSAREQLMQCIEKAKQFDDSTHVAYIYAKLMWMSLEDNKPSDAESYLMELSKYNYSTCDFRTAFISRVIARYHFELTKDYRETVRFANSSCTLYDKIGMKRDAGLSLKYVVQSYKLLGEKDLALEASDWLFDLIE